MMYKNNPLFLHAVKYKPGSLHRLPSTSQWDISLLPTTVPPTPVSNFCFRSRWEDQGPRLAGAKTTFVLATHYRCTLCIIIVIHKPCDYVPQSLQFMEITTTDECNKLIHKQCHIICMTSYAQHHLHHILLIMSYLLPWVCPTSTLSFHDMVPGDTSSHFYSIEVSSL